METTVLPINYIDDLEKYSRGHNVHAVGIDEMSITYTQNADTNSREDETQTLKITSRMAEAVGIGEEGFYFNIEIPEGSHWSIDSGEDLKALVDDFKWRLYYTTMRLKQKNKDCGEKETHL